VQVGVYVDGYNLYYGARGLCGRGTAGWRWLDIRALSQRLVSRASRWQGAVISRVVYCTAVIDAATNPSGYTTRKLMADGQRPLGTGFFFALGHSSLLLVAGTGLAIAARVVFGAVVDPNSGYESVGKVIGTALAATFLYLIAALNLVVLAGIVKVLRGMRQGLYDEDELERQLQARGLMWRFFGRFMRSITKTRHMFFVGFIFGLGLLFAGGMTLFDTADGCFMNFAYGWAFARPVRKVYYNLVITSLSIAAAFLIGTIEIFGLLSGELHIHGGFWDFMASFNINKAGFAIAGLFAAVWAIAIGYWKIAKVETRWAIQPAAPRQPAADGPHPAPGTPAAGPAGPGTP
jgi:nickel/cobalt transporter (NiCoT) family protein